MKVGYLLAGLLVTADCVADWSTDFLRFQCVPELGAIFIDAFSVSNPDEYWSANKIKPDGAMFDSLIEKSGIYEFGSRGFQCNLAGRNLVIEFDVIYSSQGETLGSIAIEVDSKLVASNLDLQTRIGAPYIKSIEIRAYESSSKLNAIFHVMYPNKHEDMLVWLGLDGESLITSTTLQNAARKKYP